MGNDFGLYHKFDVKRTDGRSEPGERHFGDDYFMLDLTHDKYARFALMAYADAVEHQYPQLAADIRANPNYMPNSVTAEPETPPEDEREKARQAYTSSLAEERWEHDYAINLEASLRGVGLDRMRPHTAQPHTFLGERGKYKILGLTMRDLCDCVFAAMYLSSSIDQDDWPTDIYQINLGEIDPTALMQNFAVMVERYVGVYPNTEGKAPIGGTTPDLVAFNHGIDTRESVREGLIAFRAEAMKQWPAAIPETILLSHAIWWLANVPID